MLSHDNGVISQMLTESDVSDELRAPFPWFGGKRRVAPIVWPRFGDVATYNEPFAGSLAVLLARPHTPRVETVNDLDCYLANFWRALQADPDGVAYHADGPVNEADLHARHRWLVEHRPEAVMTDPEFYDVQIAGWWVWGQCLWIGSGWCQKPEWTGRVNAGRRARGINAAIVTDELRERCYSEDHISADVRAWAIEHGDDPKFRIALCGYEGEHDMPSDWECVAWKAHGGYSRTERGVANRERERIWFSPHCLKPELPLFAGANV